MTARESQAWIGRECVIVDRGTGLAYTAVIRDAKYTYGQDRVQIESVSVPGATAWVSADRVRVGA